MAYKIKMYAAFIASFSVALTLASNETFGGSVAGQERNVWEPRVGVTQSISGDTHFTYTYEPLWDAAHRYPPVISPSETGGCPAQTATVPLGDGKGEQTVTIVRCY